MGYTRVIGIDPSLTATAIVDDETQLLCGGDSKLGDERLTKIYEATYSRLVRVGLNPAEILVVMEDLPKHANSAGITGMVHGVIRLALAQAGVAHARVVPATLKAYATGSGKSEKGDMRMQLYKRTGMDLRNDNLVDAWWLRQAGLDHIGHPDAIRLPQAQRARLDKVRWPAGGEPLAF